MASRLAARSSPARSEIRISCGRQRPSSQQLKDDVAAPEPAPLMAPHQPFPRLRVFFPPTIAADSFRCLDQAAGALPTFLRYVLRRAIQQGKGEGEAVLTHCRFAT